MTRLLSSLFKNQTFGLQSSNPSLASNRVEYPRSLNCQSSNSLQFWWIHQLSQLDLFFFCQLLKGSQLRICVFSKMKAKPMERCYSECCSRKEDQEYIGKTFQNNEMWFQAPIVFVEVMGLFEILFEQAQKQKVLCCMETDHKHDGTLQNQRLLMSMLGQEGRDCPILDEVMLSWSEFKVSEMCKNYYVITRVLQTSFMSHQAAFNYPTGL